MGLNANEAAGGGGNFEQMEAGTYPARLVGVVDLGLQARRPYQGQEKAPRQEIALTYEFVDEFLKDEDGQPQEDKPRWLTEFLGFYNLDIEKAKSTLRYNALDPQGAAAGDFTKLVGTPVNVTVVLNPGKGKYAGRTFENIGGVATMRSKDVERCPELVNAAFVFDLSDPDVDVFMKLPKFVQTKIKENLEYAGSPLEAALAKVKDDGPGEADAPADQDDLDDENPY